MRLFFAFFLAFCSLLSANDADDFIVLPEETVHHGDYFAAGGSIEVSGVVKGDVYVVGSQIVIDGTVEGDVIATGGSIDIAGRITGSVRLAGGQIEINGQIGRNATVMGGNIQISSSSRIDGNVVLTGGIVDLAGTIGGDLTLTASTARITGDIEKNLHAYVGKLRLSSRANIGGNLEYSSSSEAYIDQGAEIRGEVIYHPSVVQEFFRGKWRQGLVIGSRFAGIVMNFFFSFIIGLLFIKVFPKKLKGTLQYLQERPWKAFWIGFLMMIVIPMACLLLLVSILGFPFAIALVVLGLLGFFAAKVFPVIWLSNRFFPRFGLKKNSLLLFFFGLVLFFFLQQIPFFGGLISLVATFLGLGAIMLGRIPKRKKKA